MENTEEGEIHFHSQDIGAWTFIFTGIGTMPTAFPIKDIKGSLSKDFTGSISFRNPFKKSIVIAASLATDYKSQQVFELLS